MEAIPRGWKAEWGHPKWESWSAHLAWGCVLFLYVTGPLEQPWRIGFAAAFLAGGLWEIIGGPRLANWPPRVIDFITWPLGGGLGLLGVWTAQEIHRLIA